MPFVIIGLIVIVLAVVVWWIVTYNNIKVLGLKVKEGLSGIDVALTKRYDVLTKMLDVVKGFRKYEKEVLTQIVELRSGMSIKEKSAANQSMDELHREINVIAEQYPELRSSNTFVELERAIVDVEEHLQAARRLYNANVTAYNAKLITFPNSIVAGAMGATEKELFEAEESKKSDVKMEF